MHFKFDKTYLVFYIIVFELVALNSPFTENEYLSSGVKVLTNGVKILPNAKTNIFELKFPQSDRKVRWDYYCADFCIVQGRLTSWLSQGVLKRDSLDIYISTSFTECNFGNT